jgi:hypothetical protein
MWLIDFCHNRSTECIKMAESCADIDTERRKAWLDLAKQWSRLPEETVLRKAGAAALVHGMMRSRADQSPAAALIGPAPSAVGEAKIAGDHAEHAPGASALAEGIPAQSRPVP